MKKISIWVMSVIFFPTICFGLEAMKINPPGKPHITVFIAKTPDFIREWVNTPPSHAPTVKRIKEARYSQMVHAGFVVTGYSVNQDSKIDFFVSVQITDPKGAILLKKDHWAVHNKLVVNKKGVIIADPVLDITIEPGDPLGKYQITATVTDNVSQKQATGTAILTIKN